MSTRNNDNRGEQALGLFLDKYFYPALIRDGYIEEANRTHKASEQIIGCDVVIRSNGKTVKIDEKAQLYFIGTPLSSFVVEVSFINTKRDKILNGWFVDTTNITDKYLFIWINRARTDKLYRIVSEDFEEIEVAFIDKKRIQEYLEKEGFPIRRIKDVARRIRAGEIRAKDVRGKEFYFSYTTNRDEQPINIVLKKGLIEDLSSSRYLISKNNTVLIK